MTDRFANFSRGPDAPYTDAVGVEWGPDDIEVTAALFINMHTIITLVLADSEIPISLVLGPGLHRMRVKRVLYFEKPVYFRREFLLEDGSSPTEDLAATCYTVVALY